MKKLFTLIFFALGVNSFSQLSISLDNKYGFKMLGSYHSSGSYGNYVSNTSSTNVESVKYCFGNGYQPGINLRYGFKNNFGIDLGFAYLLGRKTTTTYKNSTGTNSSSEDIKARFYRMMIGFSFIGDKKLSPVLKAGLIAGVGKIKIKSTVNYASFNPNPPYNPTTAIDDVEQKFHGGISLGFYSNFGLSFAASEKLNILLCLDVVVQNYSPNKSSLITKTVDGKDQLPTMSTSQKETVYYKNYTQGPTSNQNAPSQGQRFSVPLSSFGPSLTFMFKIGKKKEAESAKK